MAKLKEVVDAMAMEVVGGWHVGDVLPNNAAETSKITKDGENYRFDVTYYRSRGRPKKYRLTVEEIY